MWTAIVILLSTTPSSTLPKISWDQMISLDKLGHFIFYSVLFVLTALWLREWRARKRPLWIILVSFAYCLGLGAAMELLQLFMHLGRHFDFLDLIANIIGALGGLAVWRLFFKR